MVNDVASTEDCIELCQAKTSFTCLSINYWGDHSTMQCQLSAETKFTNPDAYYEGEWGGFNPTHCVMGKLNKIYKYLQLHIHAYTVYTKFADILFLPIF